MTENMMKFQQMPLRFRVWDTDEKILIYEAEKTYDYMLPEPHCILAENFGALIEDDRYIISQDTGFKDKNGVYVYTGDIVKCWDGEAGLVYYDESLAKMRVKIRGWRR